MDTVNLTAAADYLLLVRSEANDDVSVASAYAAALDIWQALTGTATAQDALIYASVCSDRVPPITAVIVPF